MNLINRVKNILLAPKTEWYAINTETYSGMPLVMSYLLPLAAAAAIATFIGYSFLFAFGSLQFGLTYAVLMLVQIIVSVYVNALVTDALAPSFASEKNLNKSLQLVVYAATPFYLGSLLNIIPIIGWLGTLAGGVYSIYLFYIGLPILKKTPQDKVPGYLIVIVLVLLVLYYIIRLIFTRLLFSAFFGGVYGI